MIETQEEVRNWLDQHISMGAVDPRTYEHSAHEVLTYHAEHPEEQDFIRQALVEVIRRFQWRSPQQMENAAYLAVNLESAEALDALIKAAGKLSDPNGEYATEAIAASRSFPDENTAREISLPSLFRWLKSEAVAHLAFETLTELTPEDAGAYLSALSYYHQENQKIVENALTHLYYRNGNAEQGDVEVKSVIQGFTRLIGTVSTHPLLPKTFKKEISSSVKVQPL